MDGKAEAPGTPCQSGADAAHADDADALAIDAMAKHEHRSPALPVAGPDQPLALADPARRGQYQGHGHVGGVFRQDTRRIGDGDAALAGAGKVDVIDAGAERGDQAQFVAGLGEDGRIDAVRHRRHQDIGDLRGLDQLGLAQGMVVDIEPDIEQLHHPGFDHIRQLPRHHDQRLQGHPLFSHHFMHGHCLSPGNPQARRDFPSLSTTPSWHSKNGRRLSMTAATQLNGRTGCLSRRLRHFTTPGRQTSAYRPGASQPTA